MRVNNLTKEMGIYLEPFQTPDEVNDEIEEEKSVGRTNIALENRPSKTTPAGPILPAV
jgi:hypothetical protein